MFTITAKRGQPLVLSDQQATLLRAMISRYTGLTNTEFAKSIGMHETLLSKYINGKLPLTHECLTRILSGIRQNNPDGTQTRFDQEWEIKITVQRRLYKNGQVARTADSTDSDGMLSSVSN